MFSPDVHDFILKNNIKVTTMKNNNNTVLDNIVLTHLNGLKSKEDFEAAKKYFPETIERMDKALNDELAKRAAVSTPVQTANEFLEAALDEYFKRFGITEKRLFIHVARKEQRVPAVVTLLDKVRHLHEMSEYGMREPEDGCCLSHAKEFERVLRELDTQELKEALSTTPKLQ